MCFVKILIQFTRLNPKSSFIPLETIGKFTRFLTFPDDAKKKG